MRFFISLAICLLVLVGCDEKSREIEFFTHEGCPYCAQALKYIKVNYPKLPIKIMEIETPENMQKFLKCAQRFHLNKQKLGTPLICMGGHYLMGWSKDSPQEFNNYIKPYLKK